MKRVLRQAGIFVALVLITGILRLPFADYDQTLRQKLLEHSAAAGLYTTLDSVQLRFPGVVRFQNVETIIPSGTLPVSLRIDQAETRLRWFPLLLLRLDTETILSLYQGALSVHFVDSLSSGNKAFVFKAEELLMGEHPILKAYSVSGTLTFDGAAELVKKERGFLADNGQFSVRIDDGTYEGGHLVKGLVKLPAIASVSANAMLALAEGVFSLQRLSVSSSVGTIRGGGKFSLSDSLSLKQADLSFSIALSEQGAQVFGPYLALGANISPENPPTSWQIVVTKKPGFGQPNVSIQPS